MMEDSTLIDKRFHIQYPSEASQREEIRTAMNAWLQNLHYVHDLGPRKGFYYLMQAKQIEKTLRRWKVPVDNPDDFVAYYKELHVLGTSATKE